MLFVDDTILIDIEIRGEVNDRLEDWKQTLEFKGLKLSSVL